MSATLTSWRDRIKVHPAADLFPMMAMEELEELAKDIAENDLRQPIVFWTAELRQHVGRNGPKDVFLLDGRNRLAAIERGDDPERVAEQIESALYIEQRGRAAGCGWGAELLYGDVDPWKYVASANLHRRHLNREQKRELIANQLKAKPERSDNATAKLAKASDKTVGGVRQELERRSEIPNVSTRTDTTGRQQPAHRPPPAAVVHRSSLPPPPSKEEQIRQLRERSAAGSVQSHDHLQGRDPADFKAATALLGLLHHIARASENIDIKAALRGLGAAELKDARDAVAVARGWVAKADALLWSAQ